MLRNLVGVAALVTAVGWGIVFAVASPGLALAWCILWCGVFAADFQLYRDTAPDPPVVEGEVDQPPLPPTRK